MIIYSRVTSDAAEFPVTLDEVKAQLRVDGNEDDVHINSLIKAATRVCETYAGLSFITQTRTVKLDRFYGDEVILPYGPVVSITSVTYTDSNGDEQTVDPAAYTLDTQSGINKLRVTDSWPVTDRSLNNVVITYVAGTSAVNAPEAAKLAIKERVTFWYQHRGDEMAESDEWMNLLDTIKVYWNAEY